MAIDTAAKRFSIMEDETTTPAIPMPDGTISAGDRQWFLWSYSGILWDALVQVFHWVIPTDTADGQSAAIIIFSSDGVTKLEDGSAVAASGIFEFQAATGGLVDGDKTLAFWHQWDLDPATQSIYGGASIAEAVLQ